jgi:hypothetical protein
MDEGQSGGIGTVLQPSSRWRRPPYLRDGSWLKHSPRAYVVRTSFNGGHNRDESTLTLGASRRHCIYNPLENKKATHRRPT